MSIRQNRFIRTVVVQAILLVLPLVILFPSVFLEGQVLVPAGLLFDTPPWSAHTPENFEPTANKLTLDALVAFHMYYTLSKRAIDEGEWPLWNRYEFAGIPLMANYQTAIFYPLRLLHQLIDLPWATTIYDLAKLWLCGMSAFLCACGLGLRTPAARFMSFAWMLCSYNATWFYWPVPMVAAWAPLVFLGVERILQMRLRQGFFLLAFSGTLLLLAGHPESAFAFAINVGVYFVLRLIVERRSGKALGLSLAAAIGAWVLVGLVCSAQLIPFIEYLPQSQHFLERPHGDTSAHSVPAGSWVNLFVPRFYGVTAAGNFWGNQYHSNFTNLIYPGIVVWLGIAMLKTVKEGTRAERRRIACLVLPAVMSTMFIFNIFLVRPILGVPPFSSMWYLWHTGPALFCVILLAAHGVELWFRRPRRWPEFAWLGVPMMIVAGAVVYLYHFNAAVLGMQGLAEGVRLQLWIALAVSLAGLAVIASNRVVKRPALVVAVLTAILAADLVAAVRGIHPTSPREHVFFKIETTDWLLAKEQPVRSAIVTAYIPSGFLPIYGLEQTIAYDGILPLRFYRLFETLGEDFWRNMMAPLGVRYVLHDPRYTPYIVDYSPDDFTLVSEMEDLEIWEYTKAFPRAWLVDRYRVFDTPETMLDALREPEFDPGHVAYIEAELPAEALKSEVGEIGSATVTNTTENSITVQSDAARDAILILSEAYYPGWRAEIDGEPASIFPVYSVLRGVRVPVGQHTVTFAYYPTSFRIGLGVSGLSLVLSALMACFLVHRIRRLQR